MSAISTQRNRDGGLQGDRGGVSATPQVRALEILGRLKKVEDVRSLRDEEVILIGSAMIREWISDDDISGPKNGISQQRVSVDEQVRSLCRCSRIAGALHERALAVTAVEGTELRGLSFLRYMLQEEVRHYSLPVREMTARGSVSASTSPLKPAKPPRVVVPKGKRPGFGTLRKDPPAQPVGQGTIAPVSPSASPSLLPVVAVKSEMAKSVPEAALTKTTPGEHLNMDEIAAVLQGALCPNDGYARHDLEGLVFESSRGMQEAIWAAAEIASRFSRGASLVILRGVLDRAVQLPRPHQMNVEEAALWRTLDLLWPAIKKLYVHENPET